MWDLSRPGIKPISPALADGFLTTEPPETSRTEPFERYLRSSTRKGPGGGVFIFHHMDVSWDFAVLSVLHYLPRQAALSFVYRDYELRLNNSTVVLCHIAEVGTLSCLWLHAGPQLPLLLFCKHGFCSWSKGKFRHSPCHKIMDHRKELNSVDDFKFS